MLTYELRKMSEGAIKGILSRRGVDISRAAAIAGPIIDDVRLRGDTAVIEFAKKLDGFRGSSLTLSRNEIRSSRKRVSKEIAKAFAMSKQRIEAFHSRQRLEPFVYRDECGILGQRVVPLERVGIYVPGGTANYASTVLMASIPARIAGVEEIAMCTPGSNGAVPAEILAAADLCGITEVHPVGGAHSIAAMAYGSRSIPRVQKIVGPGGNVVSAAKLLVRNDCEIDILAGPSEVLVIADKSADPSLVAADMLAQLEHDPLARALLVTDSGQLADRTRTELRLQLAKAGRREIASEAARRGAVAIITETIAQAVEFSNDYAPEHLLVDVKDPMAVLDRVRSAGSVFLGRYSSVAFGDYCSGTNHILPTKGMAAMKSSLSVYDFLKIIPYQRISRIGAAKLSKVVDVMANAEGFPAHAEAALARTRMART
jgi:histidinol dehydrogenase